MNESKQRSESLRAKAEEIGKLKRVVLEARVDAEITRAARVYEECKRQENPYAMHQAIEALSVEVLVEILHKHTHEALTSDHVPEGASGYAEHIGREVVGTMSKSAIRIVTNSLSESAKYEVWIREVVDTTERIQEEGPRARSEEESV